MPFAFAEETSCGTNHYWNETHQGCFFNGTLNLDKFEELDPDAPQPDMNPIFDSVVSHDYLYASMGWDEKYSIQQYRNVLHGLTVKDDGQINKSSYPAKMTLNGSLKMGVVQNFIIAGMQLIDNFLIELNTRVNQNEADLQLIKDSGWTGTFRAGDTCNVQSGVIVSCN
jgi:hypothetical protein